MASAVVSCEKLWRGREKLRVFFNNPEFLTAHGWTCKGGPMNVIHIISWANQWHTGDCPQMPMFEYAERDRDVDIRVEFSSE